MINAHSTDIQENSPIDYLMVFQGRGQRQLCWRTCWKNVQLYQYTATETYERDLLRPRAGCKNSVARRLLAYLFEKWPTISIYSDRKCPIYSNRKYTATENVQLYQYTATEVSVAVYWYSWTFQYTATENVNYTFQHTATENVNYINVQLYQNTATETYERDLLRPRAGCKNSVARRLLAHLSKHASKYIHIHSQKPMKENTRRGGGLGSRPK